MRNYFKKSLSFMMVLSMVYSPVASQKAFAGQTKDDFKATCSQALKDVESKKSTQGDQKMGYCVQADMAREAKNLETAKSIVFLTAAAIDTAMAITIKIEQGIRTGGQAEVAAGTAMLATIYTAGAGAALIMLGNGTIAQANAAIESCKQVCTITNIAAAAAGIATDITGKSIINKTRDKYGQAKEQILDISTLSPVITSVLPLALSGGESAAAGTGSAMSELSGCIMGAVMLGLQGGVSVSQSVSSKNAQKAAVKNAKEVGTASKGSVTSFSNTQLAVQAPKDSEAPTSASAVAETESSDKCDKENGNAYLSCVGGSSPEIAAISNSNEFMGLMNKALHGKNLGDVIKNYDGESDLNDYVANALGMTPGFIAKVASNNEKLVKNSGFLENYSPMGYTRTAAAKPKVSNDLDFSKLMSGMMGKMDPGGDTKEKRDPSELVFRQLELLPADKIEGNKDISLFARIAFRYRKNVPNVEQLNWSRPENQSVPAQKK
jgi:hypothetical protein